MFNRLKLVKTPREFWGWFLFRVKPSAMSDRLRLEMKYLYRMHEHLDLDHPVTFNEKLQWLKLYDRNPRYTMMVDKYLVKEYIVKILGEGHVIPTLAVYQNADEIDFEALPNQFVMKCNHDSHSVIICRDKSKLDFDSVKQYYRERLKFEAFDVCEEWAYKNVPRRILVEKYMEDLSGDALMDYKWFCFDGEPKIMYMSRDASAHPTTDFFDMDFNPLPIRMQDPNSDVLPDKPAQFEEMMAMARRLSQGIPQVRVDFYVINGQIYFGEFTFYHCGGMQKIKPDEWNVKMGDMIRLYDSTKVKRNIND